MGQGKTKSAVILKLQGNIGVAAYGVIANLSLVVISLTEGVVALTGIILYKKGY